MLQWYFYVGIVAAAAIAIFSMPQLINIIKTKNTTGVPLAMYIILAIGGLCFVISVIGQLAQLKVAALSAALPVLIANAISFGTAIAILIFKFLNKHWAKKFNVTEKDFCDNYPTYKAKIQIIKAEKAKEKALKKQGDVIKTAEPQQTSAGSEGSTIIEN